MYLCIHHRVCSVAFYLGADMHSPEQQDSTSHHLVQPSWDLPVGTSVGPPAQTEHPSPAVQDQADSLPSHAAPLLPQGDETCEIPSCCGSSHHSLNDPETACKEQEFFQAFLPTHDAQRWIQAMHGYLGWSLQVISEQQAVRFNFCLQMLLATCFLICFPLLGSQRCCQHFNMFLYEFQFI